MLFILTGQVQTGKTRWLSNLIARLEESGVPCYGVLTPGVWKETDAVLTKQGIEAVLLPQHQVIPFATRADLVSLDAKTATQSSKARLSWHIYEEALEQINQHLDKISAQAFVNNEAKAPSQGFVQGLLVIDELGQLELASSNPGGLVKALELLSQGPTPLYQHALVVVRSSLFDMAAKMFEQPWTQIQAVHPCKEDEQLVFDASRPFL